MTDLSITEAGSVQFPMVRHAAEVGWTPLSPSDGLAMRGGEAGLLFRGVLEETLRRFNPWVTDDAVRSVVENLQALPSTIEGNRQMLAWLRGERQWYDEAEQRHRQVRLVDFDDPGANVLHVTWEWRLKPPARKGNRADVMFVGNGVPVAIVEHKNPTDADAIERGITQLRRYEIETHELMGAAQLFNVTHLLDYWYGVTWNLSRRYMARWKETQEESYRFAVQSFFEPTDFLRTLRDWVLFYVEDGEMRKTVLRQHQRRAVDRIVERCAEPVKHRGLIWHAQGAGKTFTLLTAARLVLECGCVGPPISGIVAAGPIRVHSGRSLTRLHRIALNHGQPKPMLSSTLLRIVPRVPGRLRTGRLGVGPTVGPPMRLPSQCARRSRRWSDRTTRTPECWARGAPDCRRRPGASGSGPPQ